ncbi:hypothetical protein PCANB_002425 [Pneumocystis canis]|nr:hypothetical protein PCK1_002483 [Pneumocystis canis]KAG5438705.1 hypothetical protein PCANB_002425 [Pneumocystis canis]
MSKRNDLKLFDNINISKNIITKQIANVESFSEEKINYLIEEAQRDLEDLSKKQDYSETINDNKNIQYSLSAWKNYHIDPIYISKIGNVNSLNPMILEKSYKVIDDRVDHLTEHKPSLSRKEKREEKEKTAGKDWFYMHKPELTQSLKTELKILKMRNVLDPKRHYKKDNNKELPKYFQIGTMIDDVLNTPIEDFFKKKTNTILDEILEDQDRRQYFKRKYNDIQKAKMSGKKAFYKKLKEKRNPFR